MWGQGLRGDKEIGDPLMRDERNQATSDNVVIKINLLVMAKNIIIYLLFTINEIICLTSFCTAIKYKVLYSIMIYID